MNMFPLKTKWMLIIVLMTTMVELGGIRPVFAGPQTQLYLVSIGVGDADLITLRAVNTIRASDVIVCRKETEEILADYVKGKEILDASLAGWRTYKKSCDGIKDPGEKAGCLKSRESRAKLIARIRSAVASEKTVSVLGGGDLMIYGGPYRWYLEEFNDLHPKVVPGVSCLNAANAALGRDIMLGKVSRSAVLTTYREIDRFAEHHPTMIVFTMHTEFEDLVEKLKIHYPLKTPIAIVFHAGYKDKEHIMRARLDNILEQTRNKRFPFEHLVYVGDFMN